MCPLSNVRCEATGRSRRRLRDFGGRLDGVDLRRAWMKSEGYMWMAGSAEGVVVVYMGWGAIDEGNMGWSREKKNKVM